ncbi:MAG TPA: hypothetical protein PK208_13870 [Fibrobacteria bacterium]|nr:hypothetical protein [Fibrobacteria bacterium]
MLVIGASLLPRRIESPRLRLVDVERHGEVFAVLTYAVGGRLGHGRKSPVVSRKTKSV